jgi:hypothetical protein
MISERDAELWSQFNLREQNPDQSGILYAIRYDTEDLLAHRNVVVETLAGTGAQIVELAPGVIGVDGSGIDRADKPRAKILLEELSVTSEAIEYHEAGLNPGSIDELAEHLKSRLIQGIAIGADAVAFDFANIQISQIVRDIVGAQEQNGVLSAADYKIVKDLGEFAATKAQQIASGSIITLGG